LQVRGVTAQDVRNRVVEEMRRDWPSYKPFVDPELHADYLADMARSTENAGEPELVALSKVYGVTIRMWGADAAHDRDIRAPSVGADAHLVHLLHRDARNFRDHYFAVQLSERGEVRSHAVAAHTLPCCACMGSLHGMSPKILRDRRKPCQWLLMRMHLMVRMAQLPRRLFVRSCIPVRPTTSCC
jgi:hypothetical protein